MLLPGQETRVSRLHFKETLLYDEHDSCAMRASNIYALGEQICIDNATYLRRYNDRERLYAEKARKCARNLWGLKKKLRKRERDERAS